MDEFNTRAALLQQRMLGSEMTKQVCTFFSTSNQLAFRHKLGRKIKAIKERLAAIRDDRQFHLEESRIVARRREDTHSYVPEEEVTGRNKDKMAIFEYLMDENIEENLGVISIVGTGGLGKTTLAQLVYNDEKVQKHFDLKLWVCVSVDFNVRMLVEKILKSTSDKIPENLEMDRLQKELRKELNGKKYLLVLDDVWNDNRELWLNLKILFEKVAFKRGQEPSNSKIVESGMQIVEKCGGIPLAIRTVGMTLYFNNSETEWSSFLEMEFSRIPQTENEILPTLKLSYDNLPSHLKHCFTFCKLFPKGYEIDVNMLIDLWISLGFVKQSDPTKSFLIYFGDHSFKNFMKI